MSANNLPNAKIIKVETKLITIPTNVKVFCPIKKFSKKPSMIKIIDI